MNKPVYSGPSILELSKTVMHESQYDYAKPKCGEKANISFMDTNNFAVHIKTEDIYVDIVKDVEQNLVLQTMNNTGYFQNGKTKT